jgi:hypothetical protein
MYCDSTTTPTPGCRSRSNDAATIPSSLLSGGIPDVGQHGIGPVLLDGRQQLGQVDAQGHDVDVGLRRQNLDDPLTDQQRILSHHDPYDHWVKTLVGNQTGPTLSAR